MLHEERDAAYIWDILDAAETIVEFTNGLKLHDYLNDRKLQLAIEREIEIIGEAARRLSDGFKSAHPEVPWFRIIAQRNVIAHEYGDIKQDRIYVVASTHIPGLIELLKPLLPPLPADSDE
ncbi:MAG: HepT-like ribonuclease domain-containing protein [Armatimonadota bacterium]